MSQPQLAVKLVYEDATAPRYATPGAIGMDICSYVDIEIPARDRRLVPTGIVAYIPDFSSLQLSPGLSYYLRVAARSGLSVKHSLDVGGGVVDSDYRGEIFVCLINNGSSNYQVKKGDKIAQLIVESAYQLGNDNILLVEEVDTTDRGSNCLGSTG